MGFAKHLQTLGAKHEAAASKISCGVMLLQMIRMLIASNIEYMLKDYRNGNFGINKPVRPVLKGGPLPIVPPQDKALDLEGQPDSIPARI